MTEIQSFRDLDACCLRRRGYPSLKHNFKKPVSFFTVSIGH